MSRAAAGPGGPTRSLAAPRRRVGLPGLGAVGVVLLAGALGGGGLARVHAAIPAAIPTATPATTPATIPAAVPAYRTGPPAGHTGAFGEPDCGVCHFDAVRDDTRGSVGVDAPDGYAPGADYAITVTLAHPDLEAGGFQLSARFADGPRAGEQAGGLAPASERVRVVREGGVAYASHSVDGTWPVAPVEPRHPGPSGDPADRPEPAIRWVVRWTAPDSGAVAFDVAAQVANDDDSEFGERLFRTRVTVSRR